MKKNYLTPSLVTLYLNEDVLGASGIPIINGENCVDDITWQGI